MTSSKKDAVRRKAREKPSVYLDTSIVSAYWYSGADVTGVARRLKTREWWEQDRADFSLWASATTENELGAGRYAYQNECLRMVRRLPFLAITREVRELAAELANRWIVPPEEPEDALQISVCAVHQIDYLLTWNYAHLANAVVQEKLRTLCEHLKLRAPLMVSPESIPRSRFGQTVRREKS